MCTWKKAPPASHCFQVDVMLPCTRVCADAHFRPVVVNLLVHRICKQVKLERVTTGVEGGEEDERPQQRWRMQ